MVVEGQGVDGGVWEEYEFLYKPGALDRVPPFVGRWDGMVFGRIMWINEWFWVGALFVVVLCEMRVGMCLQCGGRKFVGEVVVGCVSCMGLELVMELCLL